MRNPTLRTSADDLYELVKSRKKISVEDAAKFLKIPEGVVQALVDFLVEERIFGIEYKFTTPYVYLSKENQEIVDLQKKAGQKVMSKKEFFQRAGKWNVSLDKINELWKRYVGENIDSIKEKFYAQAASRNVPKDKIDLMWAKYQTYLQ